MKFFSILKAASTAGLWCFTLGQFAIAAPDGLVHRWSFNGGLTDSVGSSNATIVNPDAGGGTADLTTNPGQIRLMGGESNVSAYVSLGSGLLDGRTSPVTIELWATNHGIKDWSRILDFGSSPTENLFMSWTRDVTSPEDRVAFNDGDVEIGVNDTNAPYLPEVEYHIVLIVTPGGGVGGTTRVTWYTSPSSTAGSGAANGSFDAPYPLLSFADSLDCLGHSQWGDPTANASYNEVRFYERALTPAEIEKHRSYGPESIGPAVPLAANDSTTVGLNGSVSFDVLANDQGNSLVASTLTIATPPLAGTATVQPNGKILYTNVSGIPGNDTFTYTVQDAAGVVSNPAQVAVTISPAFRLPAPSLKVPGAPPLVAMAAVDAFPGLTFANALCIRNAPGETTRLFIGERDGTISYVPDTTAATPERHVLLDIRDRISFDTASEGEIGLLSFAFHPNFAKNGYIYVYYTAPGDPYIDRLSRFTVATDDSGQPILTDPVALPSTELILFNQADEAYSHNAGDLHFGPDGYLYISMGDEGDQMNIHLNAQRIDKDLFSAVLRIDVDKTPGSLEPNSHPSIPTDSGLARFSIPKTNPFVPVALGGDWNGTYNGSPLPDLSKVRTEFWVTGLRSPWRMSFDTQAPYDLWLGDVGQDTYEEVDVLERGKNYGWAYREGTHQTPGTPSDYIGVPPAGFTYADPVWDYPHPGGSAQPNYSGQSVTGGVVYHGTAMPTLTGSYIFADFRLGNIWSLRRTTGAPVVKRIAGDAGIAAFGIDPFNGDVLMANYTQGKIKRLVQQDTSASEYPQLLSQTGIFADLTTLAPNPGIVPYEPNVPFWSDNALKTHWFSVPNDSDQIGFVPDGTWTFPEGMIWVKHFDLELQPGNPASKKRVETRILVRTATGSYGVSYRWNRSGTDATLVPDSGAVFGVPITVNGTTTSQTWEIPARSTCMLCHTPVAGHALSFNTRQMDHLATMNGLQGDQISLLKLAGYLTGPAPTPALVPPFVPLSDDTSTVGFRVRSYLATNCVQCHQPGGAAPSSWDARPQISLEETGLINGIAEHGGTDPLDRLVVPGSPEHSLLLKRIQASDGFTRMPPVATHVLDQEAIDMVREWITTDLLQNPLYDTWKLKYFAADDPLGARDADPDHDGISNYNEFLLGTSPVAGNAPWQATIKSSQGSIFLDFVRKANRGYLIETSNNLIDWSTWNSPENYLHYSPLDEPVEFSSRSSPGKQFFRIKVSEP